MTMVHGAAPKFRPSNNTRSNIYIDYALTTGDSDNDHGLKWIIGTDKSLDPVLNASLIVALANNYYDSGFAKG